MSASEFQNKLLDRRDVLKGLFAASSLAFLTACTNGSGSGAIGSYSKSSSDVVLKSFLTAPKSIDPYCAYDAPGVQVTCQLFEPLTRFDLQNERIVPLSASSFSVNDDATQFTFKLRQATFHNGESVSSTSFKRAWERIASSSGAAHDAYGASSASFLLQEITGYAAFVSGTASDIEGIECPDDQTLVVNLSTPCADFPYLAAHPALSPVPTTAVTDADAFFASPVGNGPFRMKRAWKAGEDVDLVPFKDYWGDAPAIDGLSFIDGDNTETVYKQFLSGRLDFCEVPIEEVSSSVAKRGQSESTYEMSAGNHLVKMPELKVVYLALNMKNEHLADAEFRRALSLAIDREDISKSIYRGVCLPADDIVPPTCPGYRSGAWKDAVCDFDKANELLDKSAPKVSSDRGVELSIGYVDAGGNKELVESLVKNFEKVGITLKPVEYESKDFLKAVSAGEIDIARVAWGTETPSMARFMRPLFHSGDEGRGNVFSYADADVDAKLDAARALVDDEGRVAAYQEIDDLVSDACPVIPLMFYARCFAGSDRIEQLDIDVLGAPEFDGVSMNA